MRLDRFQISDYKLQFSGARDEGLRISYYNSKGYRDKTFVDGVILPKARTFDVAVNELTTRQRQTLLSAFSTPNNELKVIPNAFWLPMPGPGKDGRINLTKSRWQADLTDPHPTSAIVLDAWETSYSSTLDDLVATGLTIPDTESS